MFFLTRGEKTKNNMLHRTHIFIITILAVAYTWIALPLYGYSESAEYNYYNVVDEGANGSDRLPDADAINSALLKAGQFGTDEKPCTVFIPEGTYYIDKTLRIFSNTSLVLEDGVLMVGTNPSWYMLEGRHFDLYGNLCKQDENCNHNAYGQIRNVSINGGNWDRGDSFNSTRNGIISIRHGENISVTNATLTHSTDHMINLSGTRNTTVENVSFNNSVKYIGQDPDFWGDTEIGDENRYRVLESIHLDNTNKNGEPGAPPYDNTPCNNVTINNCTFNNVFSGVGNHHEDSVKSEAVTIKNCLFSDLEFNCINLYSSSGCLIENNDVDNVRSFVWSFDSNANIQNNTVTKTSYHSIFLTRCRDVDVIGNQMGDLGNDGGQGICISGSTATFTGNSIKGSANNLFYITSNSEVGLKDNILENAGTAAVRVVEESSATIIDNTITTPKTHGVSLGTNSSATIESNTIDNPGNIGIKVVEESNADSINNVVVGGSENSIYYENSSGTISGNLINKAKLAGIRVVANSDSIIQQNTIDSPGTHGISVDSSYVDLNGNSVINAAHNGILARNLLENSKVQNNDISGSEEYGICLRNTQKCEVTGNTVYSGKMHGIFAVGASENEIGIVEIKNNVVKNNGENYADIRISNYVNAGTIEGNTICKGGITVSPNATGIVGKNRICIDATEVDGLNGDVYIYTGKEIVPTVSVKYKNVQLIQGEDYELSFTDNIDAGEAKVRVTGIGDFDGMREVAFQITAANIEDATVSGLGKMMYTGESVVLPLTIKLGEVLLAEGIDYTVSYSNNINVGVASITITGVGNFTGVLCESFDIIRPEQIVIVRQPEDYIGEQGSKVYITLEATGEEIDYQWQYSKNGVTWNNSTIKSKEYVTTLNNASNGRYVRCIVTDKYGNSITSESAVIRYA